jgi:hypothetical protein
MALSQTERVLREEFAGKDNAGLRATIREHLASAPHNLMVLQRNIAFTPLGVAKLQQVWEAWQAEHPGAGSNG